MPVASHKLYNEMTLNKIALFKDLLFFDFPLENYFLSTFILYHWFWSDTLWFQRWVHDGQSMHSRVLSDWFREEPTTQAGPMKSHPNNIAEIIVKEVLLLFVIVASLVQYETRDSKHHSQGKATWKWGQCKKDSETRNGDRAPITSSVSTEPDVIKVVSTS